jgi:hypothetical protein
MVPYRGHRGAPAVLPALAGVVHDRQGAADDEHSHGENDQYGGFHWRPRHRGPQTPTDRQFFMVQNEPAMNAQGGTKRLIGFAQIGWLGRASIGDSAQYQYGNKYNGERNANRPCNRALVAHIRMPILRNHTNTYFFMIL